MAANSLEIRITTDLDRILYYTLNGILNRLPPKADGTRTTQKEYVTAALRRQLRDDMARMRLKDKDLLPFGIRPDESVSP